MPRMYSPWCNGIGNRGTSEFWVVSSYFTVQFGCWFLWLQHRDSMVVAFMSRDVLTPGTFLSQSAALEQHTRWTATPYIITASSKCAGSPSWSVPFGFPAIACAVTFVTKRRSSWACIGNPNPEQETIKGTHAQETSAYQRRPTTQHAAQGSNPPIGPLYMQLANLPHTHRE